MTGVDFVAVGHVTLDRTPRGTRPGGAAYYAAITAHRAGLRVGLLTSLGPDFPQDALPAEIDVVNVPTERTTIFRIGRGRALGPEGRGRELAVLARATDLEAAALPEEWRGVRLPPVVPVGGGGAPPPAAGLPGGRPGAHPPSGVGAAGGGAP